MFRCPRCEDTSERLQANLISTFKARCSLMTRDGNINLAIERMAVTQSPPTVSSLSCQNCGHTAPENEWIIILVCYRCGKELGFGTKEAVEKMVHKHYCADLGGILCNNDYDRRYGSTYCRECVYSRNCVLGRRGKRK